LGQSQPGKVDVCGGSGRGKKRMGS